MHIELSKTGPAPRVSIDPGGTIIRNRIVIAVDAGRNVVGYAGVQNDNGPKFERKGKPIIRK